MSRPNGRAPDALRPVRVRRHYTRHAEGSVLIEFGDTRVLCNASVEDRVPHFKKGSGEGWVTAEYGMLPRATNTRNNREAARGKQSGRTQEIQRLIGRSLRAALDLKALGERTITLDCDVIQADGGTRTASITGAWIALADAVGNIRGVNVDNVLVRQIASVSVGVVESEVRLDLEYVEDSAAETDMNVVMDSDGGFIEIQGTAEGVPFSGDEMTKMIEYASRGIADLCLTQRASLDD